MHQKKRKKYSLYSSFPLTNYLEHFKKGKTKTEKKIVLSSAWSQKRMPYILFMWQFQRVAFFSLPENIFCKGANAINI